jgi:ankyrin repeat protein
VELLNRAAISGYLPAQLALGMMAAEGRGMERNLAEGHSWLSIAAAQGTKAAGTALAKLEKKMGTKNVIEAHKRSLQLHKVLVIIHGSDLKKASKSELSERLRIAATLGDVESVHILLAQGADADDPDQDGRTAVIEPAWRGYPRIVKSLIDNGANLNATDGTGKIAVMWAAINGHAPVIMNLLAAGAPLDERDKEGLSALMRAAWNGYADAVRALLAAKANTGGVRQTARSYNHGLFIWECRKPTHAL